MTKKINVSQYVIIPKNTGKDTKSDELLENLNSVSNDDIKSIWGEIENWSKEIEVRKEKIRQQELEESKRRDLERKQKELNESKYNNLERLKKLYENSDDLIKLHNETNEAIWRRVLDIVKDCKWDRSSIWNVLMERLNSVLWVKAELVKSSPDFDYWGFVRIYYPSWHWIGKTTWLSKGFFEVTVMLQYNEEWKYFESYASYWEDRLNELRKSWYLPVYLSHWNEKYWYDDKNYWENLLHAKIKFYEKLLK